MASSPRLHRADQLAGVEPGELAEDLGRLHLEGGLLEELLGDPADVLTQPGHGGKVNRVGGLVERDPAQEEVAIDLEAGSRGGEVGPDEEQPGRPGGADQGDVVLADHPLGEIADREPHLGPGRGAHDRPLNAGGSAVARPDIRSPRCSSTREERS